MIEILLVMFIYVIIGPLLVPVRVMIVIVLVLILNTTIDNVDNAYYSVSYVCLANEIVFVLCFGNKMLALIGFHILYDVLPTSTYAFASVWVKGLGAGQGLCHQSHKAALRSLNGPIGLFIRAHLYHLGLCRTSAMHCTPAV